MLSIAEKQLDAHNGSVRGLTRSGMVQVYLTGWNSS